MTNDVIRFFSENNSYRILSKTILGNWLSKAITCENKSLEFINIILCTDSYLYELNKKYLNHDTFTDIITFDLSENDLLAGEIYISIERIKENAKSFGVKVNNELHRVMIHGILHLCGYKDKSKKDKEQMTLKENYYLSIRPEKLSVTT